MIPQAQYQLLGRALEACGNDLDSVIRTLNELCLGSADTKSNLGMGSYDQFLSQGGDPASKDAAFQNNLPSNGSEWVELLVLKKTIASLPGAETAESFQQKENVLKEQIELFIGVINILKTQNDERSRKLQEMKQLVAIRHEELTRLEANNYALNMHLRQAQQRDPNPRSFLPAVVTSSFGHVFRYISVTG
ncbi:hypothetical protein MRB53_024228 [Persea americana]|uniref:Uncharacterized protein n=1 Tax=Persea americana TaxID=3435 RepID=A0ACC2LCB9_PERAE|nr:hypothetical protein MRB53_024228 [Persea americana]